MTPEAMTAEVMIAAAMAAVTAVLAVLVGARYLSPAFRERAELPKYRFQASLKNMEKNDVESE
jgi:hypothetical protein